MDFEFVRFRVNPEIHAIAHAVCERLGLPLNDVLRALVTRIATDGSVPFDLDGRRQPSALTPVPFQEYEPALWSGLKPSIEAELALELLAHFIADCSARIDEASGYDPAHQELTATVSTQRAEAIQLRNSLNLADTAAVAAVLNKYGDLVRRRRGS
jgi:antitoxin component of RelBE/YafQ-DinJ toxin-antitoxin module